MFTRSNSLSKTSPKMSAVIRDRQIEAERIRDVELLLESLFLREEVTFRLILDCLYDVGAVNLVNQKVRSRPLNTLMKAIARYSKPVFRPFMMRWGRNNCPRMITEWLHSQVTFTTNEVLLPEVVSSDDHPTLQQ